METVHWGILGAGRIAGEFAKGLALVPGAKLSAVGSRSSQSAKVFADTYNIPNRHASYQALAEDPAVDVIYIATPHPMHAENIMRCLNAGKSVLCEKPFTVNAAEAAAAIDLARKKGLFLMEGMWSRFLPHLVKVRQILALETIGAPRILTADFGFHASFDPNSRIYNPELGGGALLDVGIYVLSLASMIFGTPKTINSSAFLGKTGVDEQSAYLLNYANGAFASLLSAVSVSSPTQAYILGEEGSLYLPPSWYASKQVVEQHPGKPDKVIDCSYEGNGFQYEAQEVVTCLKKGVTESCIMPLDETLAIMQTMDTIRAQWGLRYPSEGSD